MPTFDIVSKIDGQTLDNAINTAKKEILNRYDFNDSKSTIDLDKKTNTLTIVTENDMRLKAIEGSIISRMVKQNLDAKALDFGKEQYASGNKDNTPIARTQRVRGHLRTEVVSRSNPLPSSHAPAPCIIPPCPKATPSRSSSPMTAGPPHSF